MITEKTLAAAEEMISRLLYRNLEAINAAVLDSGEQGAGCSIAIWIEPMREDAPKVAGASIDPAPEEAFRVDAALGIVDGSLQNRLAKIVYEGVRQVGKEKGGKEENGKDRIDGA